MNRIISTLVFVLFYMVLCHTSRASKSYSFDDVFTVAAYHEPFYAESPVAMDARRLRDSAQIAIKAFDRRARHWILMINLEEILNSPVKQGTGDLGEPRTVIDFMNSDGKIIFTMCVDRLGNVAIDGIIHTPPKQVIEKMNDIFRPYYTNNSTP